METDTIITKSMVDVLQGKIPYLPPSSKDWEMLNFPKENLSIKKAEKVYTKDEVNVYTKDVISKMLRKIKEEIRTEGEARCGIAEDEDLQQAFCDGLYKAITIIDKRLYEVEDGKA